MIRRNCKCNLSHLKELSNYYDYLELISLDIAQRVVEWHKENGDPSIEARYLVETSYRIMKSPIYTKKISPVDINTDPIKPAIRYLNLLSENLSPFLSGNLTGSEIIRKGGKSLWNDFNRGNPLMDIFSTNVAYEVEQILFGKDVLELGGGVGGTTKVLAEKLTNANSFVFSDIKSYFLDSIKEKLPGISFKTELLDIKHPPDEFPNFDVIFATNVIHIASDIEAILNWIYDHLREGGVVILGEGSPYSKTCPWPLDIMFSMFEGWWNILRFDQRPYPGWLLPEQWISIFGNVGFSKLQSKIFMDKQRLFGGVYRAEKTIH